MKKKILICFLLLILIFIILIIRNIAILSKIYEGQVNYKEQNYDNYIVSVNADQFKTIEMRNGNDYLYTSYYNDNIIYQAYYNTEIKDGYYIDFENNESGKTDEDYDPKDTIVMMYSLAEGKTKSEFIGKYFSILPILIKDRCYVLKDENRYNYIDKDMITLNKIVTNGEIKFEFKINEVKDEDFKEIKEMYNNY